MAALRSITSRARITPTSLVNVYHFGDFKGNLDRLLDQYFDAFLCESARPRQSRPAFGNCGNGTAARRV
jgi:hypothetical protein